MSNTIGNNYSYGVNSYAQTQTTSTAKSSQESEQTAAAQNAATETSQKKDTFEKQPQFKPDMDKIQSMKADLGNNISAFKNMVQTLFKKQGDFSDKAFPNAAEFVVDKETQLKAQAAIADDGEWGVEAVAGRIFEFAMALSGGDPSKAESLRDAVMKGFEAAEKVWGGKLPEISYKTRERIMEMFDDWSNKGNEE